MISCVECGTRRRIGVCHEVAGRYLCPECGEKVKDVIALAAMLQLSVYDLAAAVIT